MLPHHWGEKEVKMVEKQTWKDTATDEKGYPLASIHHHRYLGKLLVGPAATSHYCNPSRQKLMPSPINTQRIILGLLIMGRCAEAKNEMENIFVMSEALQTSQGGQEEPDHLAVPAWVKPPWPQANGTSKGLPLQDVAWKASCHGAYTKHQAPEAPWTMLRVLSLQLCHSPTSSMLLWSRQGNRCVFG